MAPFSFLAYQPEICRKKSVQSDIVSAIWADFELRFLNMTLTHEIIFFPPPFFPRVRIENFHRILRPSSHIELSDDRIL
jgi:hypothetical protein